MKKSTKSLSTENVTYQDIQGQDFHYDNHYQDQKLHQIQDMLILLDYFQETQSICKNLWNKPVLVEALISVILNNFLGNGYDKMDLNQNHFEIIF